MKAEKRVSRRIWKTIELFRRKHYKIHNKVPIEKEVTRIYKNEEEIRKTISYILQFIDSAKCIASSLSNLVNNLSEGILKIKRKYGLDDGK